MEKCHFKIIIILFLALLFNFSFSNQTLYEYSISNNLIVKYILSNNTYFLEGKGKFAIIYIDLPYISSGNNIYFFNSTLNYNISNLVILDYERIKTLNFIFNITTKDISSTTNIKTQTNNIISKVTNQQSITNLLIQKNQNIKKDEKNQISGYNNLSKPKNFQKIDTVILDPGHGGKDPGGIGVDNLKEKDIVLKITALTVDYLKKNGIKVYVTRSSDKYVTLKERVDKANSLMKIANPIFVSIHCNISLNPKVNGIEVYSLSDKASDEDASSVEALENAGFSISDVEATGALYSILSDLYRDSLKEISERLSSYVGKNMSSKSKTELKGLRKANFFVLKYNYMPSILVETGYLSNSEEAKKLNSLNYQKILAAGIAEGIIKFINDYNNSYGFTR